MSRPSLLFAMLTLLLCSACSEESTPSEPNPKPSVPETLVAADQNGDIYTVDASNGTDASRINTSTDDAGTMVDLGKVSSMVYVPAMSRWLIGTGANAQCSGCIQLLNTATGVATTLSLGAGSGSGFGISGLAINPANDKIYTFESDVATGRLWEVNPTDGALTVVFTNVETGGNEGNGTTFAGGTLYHIGGDELSSVDPATGTSAMIDTLSFVGFPVFTGNMQPIASMTTRASDQAVFGILKDGGGGNNTSTTYLVRVNVATAVITNVGANTNLLDGLAFVPTSALP